MKKKIAKILLLVFLLLLTMSTVAACQQKSSDPVPAVSDSKGLDYRLNEDNASYTCTGIGSFTGKDLKIPDEHDGLPVTRIKEYAFEAEMGISTVTIGNNVTEIGERAFEDCFRLIQATIPKSVTQMPAAFNWCPKLAEVYNLSEDVTFVDTPIVHKNLSEKSQIFYQNDYAFIDLNGEYRLLSYVGEETDLTLPETANGRTYDIFPYAFSREKITSIVIPDTVMAIGDNAFSGCYDLVSVKIGTDVIKIGSYAFSACKSLKNINIPDNILDLEGVFEYCESLTDIVLPSSVLFLLDDALETYSATNVYYCGTEEQASWIEIEEPFIETTKLTWYYYSESMPTTSGNFWHYVDGAVTVWQKTQ